MCEVVSTHSRLKAAGFCHCRQRHQSNSFNTQPPEGGWAAAQKAAAKIFDVSTHSRLKAAGFPFFGAAFAKNCVSTHSRLKAAGILKVPRLCRTGVSTHSRLKAAGR